MTAQLSTRQIRARDTLARLATRATRAQTQRREDTLCRDQPDSCRRLSSCFGNRAARVGVADMSRAEKSRAALLPYYYQTARPAQNIPAAWGVN